MRGRARVCEPLVEIFQHKGELRVPGRDGPRRAVHLRADALQHARQHHAGRRRRTGCWRVTSVRDALGQGLLHRAAARRQPVRATASWQAPTRTSATPGAVEEQTFQGHGGAGSRAQRRGPGWWTRSGSTRAVSRCCGPRRTRATRCSRRCAGARPTAPAARASCCASSAAPTCPRTCASAPTSCAQGYARGVPMGGELEARCARPRRLFVRADARPGHATQPRRGCCSACRSSRAGSRTAQSQDEVFDVAGEPRRRQRRRDDLRAARARAPTRCAPSGSDPDFDPGQRAFYYARVLENPTCRWSTHACNAAGVAATAPSQRAAGFEACCGSYPRVQQERAWSSPIFYRPEG